MILGWRVFGAGVMMLGLVGLAFGDFLLGQPVPKDFPFRTTLAYAAAALIIAAGAALEWPRTTARAAVTLAAYYIVVVILLMNGRVLLAHFSEYGIYESMAEQVAIAAAALIVYANARSETPPRGLLRAGQVAFGICAIVFGGAHFAYMGMTAPLVPAWLPPSREFWAVLTGLAHIAAGVAIVLNVQARLASILLTLMYASFTPLVHLPLLMADPSRANWTENAINVVLTGAAWVVADSFARARARASA